MYPPTEFLGRGFFYGNELLTASKPNLAFCWLYGLTFASSFDTISTYYKSADGKKYVFLIFHREPGMLGTGK